MATTTPGLAPLSATTRVVALAASAGGLKALQCILKALPPDLDAALIVIQHLDPAQPSHLAHILARSTRLKVKEAADRDLLERGVVFVAPPGAHLVVDDGEFLTLSHQPPVNFVRPSADELFRSLARVFGARAVVVVLTGMGQDGASAAQGVRAAGGMVIVQDEVTSEFSGMPRAAIAAGQVDQILRLQDIAGALTTLAGTRTLA